nr:leucine zipper domain-containing protein [Streptomyces platensis]
MAHADAPPSIEGRRRLVERCRTRPISHVAAEMGISRACASKWVNRYRRHGGLGLLDRSSTPHCQHSRRSLASSDRSAIGMKARRQPHPETVGLLRQPRQVPWWPLEPIHIERSTPCPPRGSSSTQDQAESFGRSHPRTRGRGGTWSIWTDYRSVPTSMTACAG